MAFKLENIPVEKQASKNFDLDALLKKEIVIGTTLTNKNKEAFYTELSVLLNAGISLKEALSLVANEQKKKKHKAILETLVNTILKGGSFSEGLQKHKDFTEYEYYSIKIGEETGTLPKVTQELGLFFKRRNEQKRTVVSALSYPIVVLITALMAVLFMLRYVVPMFADIFRQNQVELPWLTQMIIRSSGFFQQYFMFIVLFVVVLFVARKLVIRKTWYQKMASKLVLRIPFMGALLRKMYLGQFTQAVTLLSTAKVPMLSSIELTKKMIDFYPLKTALHQVEKDILQGKNLSESLEKWPIFDRKMISLLRVAEETNQNEFIFDRLTSQYNEEIQYKSKMLSTVLEPLIILFLGALVAIILIAMYLPMFTLSSVLG